MNLQIRKKIKRLFFISLLVVVSGVHAGESFWEAPKPYARLSADGDGLMTMGLNIPSFTDYKDYPDNAVKVLRFYFMGNATFFSQASSAHMAVILGTNERYRSGLVGQGVIIGNVSDFPSNGNNGSGCVDHPVVQIESFRNTTNYLEPTSCSPELLPWRWYFLEVHAHQFGVAYQLYRARCTFQNCQYFESGKLYSQYHPVDNQTNYDTQNPGLGSMATNEGFLLTLAFASSSEHVNFRDIQWGYYTYD